MLKDLLTQSLVATGEVTDPRERAIVKRYIEDALARLIAVETSPRIFAPITPTAESSR